MRLAAEDEAILAGRRGEPARHALERQLAVGAFFGAERMVPVASAHLTGDPESMGEAGLAYVEDLARRGARFVVPTTTNARNVDFECYRELGQPEAVAAAERRLRDLVVGMGAVPLDSCINYQAGCTPRFGDLDRTTGRISRASHPLFGCSIAGKVLICPVAKGGFATSWALPDLRARGPAPAALIFGWANPVMVQGAVLAGLALMDQLVPDPVAAVATGDWVRVDPKAGRVEVWRRSPAAT